MVKDECPSSPHLLLFIWLVKEASHDAIHREGFPNLDGTKHAWAACYSQMCPEVCLVGGSMSSQGSTKHHNTVTKQISFSFIRFLKSFKDV